MSKIHSDFTFADVPGFPAGSSVSGYQVTLTNGTAVVSQAFPVGSLSGDLDVTEVGDYTATMQALDASGVPFGRIVTSNTVTIAAPATVTLSLPASITLSVAA